MLELKELLDQTLSIFRIQSVAELGDALMACVRDRDTDKMAAFCDLVDWNLRVDWLQQIYQYYLADRQEKKQDYTPASVAQLMGQLAGDTEQIVDLCAGSGALIIQKWSRTPNVQVTAIELDESVIPFLLFNLAVRNIRASVLRMDALTDDAPRETWKIERGDKFGTVTCI